MIVINRDLSFGSGKADGKLSRWIIIPKQDIRNGIPRFTSQPPGIKYGRYMVGCPVENQRTSRIDQYYDGFTRGVYSTDQFFLHAWKVEVRTALCFTAHISPFAHTHDHKIRL